MLTPKVTEVRRLSLAVVKTASGKTIAVPAASTVNNVFAGRWRNDA
jgi:hypothetical protein